MRKVLTFLGASLSLTWVAAAQAQDPKAPDMFKDVDQNHWAYQAVESLRAKNIVVGYPDGYFRGKRTLTRYEFAVALDRALQDRKVALDGLEVLLDPPVDLVRNIRDGLGEHAYLALRLLGYPQVRNYLGSWKEWGDREDLPVETPSQNR